MPQPLLLGLFDDDIQSTAHSSRYSLCEVNPLINAADPAIALAVVWSIVLGDRCWEFLK